MIWSPQQDAALKQIDQWLDTPRQQVFRMFGYAGTGKTTLAKTIAAEIDGPVQFAAYTGKAAAVMRSKGCYTAQTLHSLVYNVDPLLSEEETGLRLAIKETEDPDERRRLVYALRKVLAALNQHRWVVNRDGPLASAHLLILDECSMVDAKLGVDVLSFRKPVLVLGDPGQLPPPTGAGFFTDGTPEVALTEIHRQAAENPIIRLATDVREGRPPRYAYSVGAGGSVLVTKSRDDFNLFEGQLLTGKNMTRQRLNLRGRRRFLQRKDVPLNPQAGEPIIVLRNNKDLGIFNGVIGEMATTAVWTGDGDDADLRGDVTYEGRTLADLFIDGTVFRQYRDITMAHPPLPYTKDKTPLDFGYALTVHKAQGSEWPDVCLVDDGFATKDPSVRTRWMYTAITRASENFMLYTGAI